MKNYLNKKPEEAEAGEATASPIPPPVTTALVDAAESVSVSKGFMEVFFRDVEDVKELVEDIKNATAEIKSLQDQAMSAVKSEEEAEVSQRLSKVLLKANKSAALAKRKLEHLKTDTGKMDKKKAQSDIRVRENIQSTTLQSLIAAIRAYQQAQNEFKVSLQGKERDKIRAVKPDATDEEIGQVLATGDVGAVVRESLLQPGADPIAQAYLHAVDKYQDVLKLEKSVEELHQMFIDLAVLVEAQGEMLDNVEAQVIMAKDYMQQGNKELKKALKARKQTRRRMCCFIVRFSRLAPRHSLTSPLPKLDLHHCAHGNHPRPRAGLFCVSVHFSQMLKLLLSTQSRCDGSATCMVGKSESVSGLFGPVESRFAEDRVDGQIEVALKLFSTTSSNMATQQQQLQEDMDMSLLFKDALESCIKFAPRTTISLSARVLANQGQGLSSAMISAVGALVDAGVPLVTIPILVELGVNADGSVVVTPSMVARLQNKANMIMVFMGEEQGPRVWTCQGACSGRELEDAVALGRNHASLARDEVEAALANLVAGNRDLCM
ncbi:hypothetical protein BASA81_002479 [Batrachochytrium salamandrivorans]|nr:hypothetical protein BASA81_002479 [Batrachochytrium salamandrivorans]